jgi:uncharacterized protein
MQTVTLKEQKTGELILPETINGVIQAIVENFDPEKIIIFGSYVTDNPTVDSDLDIMVIMESDQPRHLRSIPIQLLFRPMPCSMDILVFTPAEVDYWNSTVNHIITEAFRTEKVVYEPNVRGEELVSS